MTLDSISATPDEAIPLLWDNGEDVHVINAGRRMMIGSTWSRDSAIAALKTAQKITIGEWRNHRLDVVQADGSRALFETDDEKVDEFLKAVAA